MYCNHSMRYYQTNEIRISSFEELFARQLFLVVVVAGVDVVGVVADCPAVGALIDQPLVVSE